MYMLYWVIQITIVSIIFILVVHNIFIFLKNTLTVPKAKDLVDVHMEKYKHIYATLNNNEPIINNTNSLFSDNSKGTTNIDDIPMMNDEINKQTNINPLLSSNENSSMKNELKSFMKKQLSSSQSESTGNNNIEFVQM